MDNEKRVHNNELQKHNNPLRLYIETSEHDENRARYFAQSRATTASRGVAALPPRPLASRQLNPPQDQLSGGSNA